MTTIILQDNSEVFDNFLPITFTRPISEIRIGIFTIREKWQKLIESDIKYRTSTLLQPLFPDATEETDALIIASHFIPTRKLADAILDLSSGEKLCLPDGEEIASKGKSGDSTGNVKIYEETLQRITKLYDIFLLNGDEIRNDINLLDTDDYTPIIENPHNSFPFNQWIGPVKNLYIHKTAQIVGATINATAGPVYIGPGAQIMEGATIRGPIAVCKNSEIRMGARIYENTTIGPECKVGGEVSNVVFIGHSNKAHDGFLGNSVIGEWCNLGGGTVSSNLKNDYSEIKLWNYQSRRFLRTGLQFCGLIMGDHSKTGINTMINTATVFGVGVNFHGAGYPRNFVPSFTEGSVAGMHEVSVDKFLEIASRVLSRRHLELSPQQILLFRNLHKLTETFR